MRRCAPAPPAPRPAFAPPAPSPFPRPRLERSSRRLGGRRRARGPGAPRLTPGCRGNAQILPEKKADKKALADIPIPHIENVKSYAADYKPAHKVNMAYSRTVPCYALVENFVEYDLDSEDEAWLEEYNSRNMRLDEEKLEVMIHKLEACNHEATQTAFALAGASSVERNSAAAVKTTGHLSRNMAFDALRAATGCRYAVLSAVMGYWKGKRERAGKPLLRRYQAPTLASNTDPFSVFRPREKTNRPQTRRKRENDMQSFEKMKDLRQNLDSARELLELLVKRERRKRDILACECDAQLFQVREHHEPKNLHGQIEEKMMAEFRATQRKLQETESKMFKRDVSYASGLKRGSGLGDDKKNKKKKLRPWQKVLQSPMPPAPAPVEVEMLFSQPLDWDRLKGVDLPKEVKRAGTFPRVGRGGRIVFDRCRPLLTTENARESDLKPMEPRPADAPGKGGAKSK